MLLGLKIANRELFRNFSSLAGVFLFLGVCFSGFFLISAFKRSTENYILQKASELVAGDLLVSAYRDFEDSELEVLSKSLPEAEISETLGFRAMLSANDAVLFSSVLAVDSFFPLRGAIELQRDPLQADIEIGKTEELLNEQKAWIYPQILEQLGLHVGDFVQLGELNFQVTAVVMDDPGSFQAGSGISPRIYIGKNFAEKTGLLGVGSQVSNKRYYKFLEQQDVFQIAESLKENPKTENLIFVTPRESVRNLKRFFGNFNQIFDSIVLFLSLLCALASFYLFQNYFVSKLKNASIYLCFGLSQSRIIRVYAYEALFIGLLGAVVACLVGSGIVIFLNQFVLPLLPGDLVLQLSIYDYLLVVFASVILSMAFSLPILFRLKTIRLQNLLSGEGETSGQGLEKSFALSLIGLSLFFFFSAAYLLGSWWKAGAFLGFILFLWGFGLFAFHAFSMKVIPGLLDSFHGARRIALLNLMNSRLSSRLCFLVLLSLNFVFVVTANFYFSFQENLKSPSEYDIPLAFLFNIPEPELKELEGYVNLSSASLEYESPMILTRIKQKNGKDFDVDRVRQFPSRLTYRSDLYPSEKIVGGSFYSGIFDKAKAELPELSVEEGFANRHDIQLNDVLRFDIQGVSVEGKVTSFRRIEWMSFQPNFFLQFQPGVLEDAPKTFVAALHSTDTQWPQKHLFELVKRFPNLSVIDVNRTITKILEIVQKMSFSILILFSIGALVCFAILLNLIAHNLSNRREEIKIFYLYGAAKQKLYKLFGWEFVFLSLIAACLAVFVGQVASWIIVHYVMEMKFELHALLLCIAFSVPTFLSLMISLVATRRVLNSSQEFREAA